RRLRSLSRILMTDRFFLLSSTGSMCSRHSDRFVLQLLFRRGLGSVCLAERIEADAQFARGGIATGGEARDRDCAAVTAGDAGVTRGDSQLTARPISNKEATARVHCWGPPGAATRPSACAAGLCDPLS